MSPTQQHQAFMAQQEQIAKTYFFLGVTALLIIAVVFLALILVKAGKRYDQHVERYPNLLPKKDDLDRSN